MSVLNLNPDYVYEVDVDYATLVGVMENGYEQRRPQRSRSISTFKLSFKNRYYADMNTVLTLFNSSMGKYGTFTYTDPDTGNTFNARFADDKFSRKLKAGQAQSSLAIYDFDFNVVQVLT
jgi:phage-related protein